MQHLEQVILRDQANPAEATPVRLDSYTTATLRLPDPYVQIRFYLFNGSIFTVFLDGSIEGRITVGGNPLALGPVFYEPSIGPGRAGPWVEHGVDYHFIIRQHVNRAMAEHLLSAHTGPKSFQFHDLRILIGGADDGTS